MPPLDAQAIVVRQEESEVATRGELFVQRLDAVVKGEAAAAVARSSQPGTRAAVVALPTWAWRTAKTPMGRKSGRPGGAVPTFPARIEWSCGPVTLVTPGHPVTARWTLRGLGLTESGSTSISVGPTAVDGYDPPETITAASMPQRRIGAELERIAVAGEVARWQIVSDLEEVVRNAVLRAHSAVRWELAPPSAEDAPIGKLLDSSDIEELVTRILFGSPGQDGPSPVVRMLSRCMSPTAFVRVDPVRYVMATVARDAMTAVRSHIGDVHIGPKVRRISRRIGTDDLSAVLDAYREAFPRDTLGKHRAVVALDLAKPGARRPAVPTDPKSWWL
jgi:hypothetical protein